MKLSPTKLTKKGKEVPDYEAGLARALKLFGEDLPPSLDNVVVPGIGMRRSRAKPNAAGVVRSGTQRPVVWDRAWIEHRLLVEIQGGIFAGKGGHNAAGAQRDHEKNNLAVVAGFSVLYFGPNDLTTWDQGSVTVETIRRALARAGGKA